MSIPKNQANQEANDNNVDLTADANARFIAAADEQILAAIGRGEFQVLCTTLDAIDIKQVSSYYVDLGYQVRYPDASEFSRLQPVELFGDAWEGFWANGGYLPPNLKKPYRILIGWK